MSKKVVETSYSGCSMDPEGRGQTHHKLQRGSLRRRHHPGRSRLQVRAPACFESAQWEDHDQRRWWACWIVKISGICLAVVSHVSWNEAFYITCFIFIHFHVESELR